MVDELGGIGLAANPLAVPLEEQMALAGAVRAYVHQRIVEVLEHAGATNSPDLIACPSCGDRVILLDKPSTYVQRHADRVCAACGAERELIEMYRPDSDIGGEGGG
jgi:DNA-directed RNA polymerase subunit RPC12/RpoP